jgi:DNA repair protein SbcC/Rad50
MIPLQLTLQNFLSYREACLDFRGLHTACICGANGAGKSSLLEALTWVIWGESRAASDDEIIHTGMEYVRVDFEFSFDRGIYRIIRSRHRSKTTSLEFQVRDKSGKFNSLTQKGVKTTQEKIISVLKLDYKTFTNSAYLRQGKAEEFMLARAGERKEILANLLKLDEYEKLSDKAKEFAKQFKIQAEQLEGGLIVIEEQIQQDKIIETEKVNVERELNQLQALQEADSKQLEGWQEKESQRQTWQQQLTWQRQQYQNLDKDCDRLNNEIINSRQQQKKLELLIVQELEINTGYRTLLTLQETEKILSKRGVIFQEYQQQQQQLERRLDGEVNQLKIELNSYQTRLENLQQQELELGETIKNADEVTKAVEKLNDFRQQLQQLDKLQQSVAPILQQKASLQTEIERAKARLMAKIEQLYNSEVECNKQLTKAPQMRQHLLEIDTRIGELDKRKVYQQRVHEKGIEKRNLTARLQENQAACHKELEELKQKLKLLENPHASCPLCERELDEEHLTKVIDKSQNRQQEIQEQIWVIEEELLVHDRELQALRQEYSKINQELSSYDDLRQQLGQLEAQLEATSSIRQQLQQIKQEIETIEQTLVIGNYAEQLQHELTALEKEIQQLNYNEQTHALIRGEVERCRWADIKQAEIKAAKRRQINIDHEKPQILQQIDRLETTIANIYINSETKIKIRAIETQLEELNYDRLQYEKTISDLRQANTWQFKYQELQQAKQEYPLLQTRLQELENLLQLRQQDKQQLSNQLSEQDKLMEKMGDFRSEIDRISQQMQNNRKQLNELHTQQGRLQQSIAQIESLKIQSKDNKNKIQQFKRQQTIYQELGIAFGKNGIQALTIENVLPQLEAETNQILARLTGNQFHVQFITQRLSKSGSKKDGGKLIDTLDIIIADARGKRAYETYSGGEAFRINFSIRLALARLLTQRAGTSLQMLVVDEGFGTQDAEGCDRLIAAINAIASDFACILTVTHMPQFKEAFQTRIEVLKTNFGSQLSLSS